MRMRVSLGRMAYLGTIVNALAGLVACALGGPLWGGVAFLAIAIVRMALEVQALRTENADLRVLLAQGSPVGAGDAYADAPESEMRPKLSSIAEARISQVG